VQPFLPVYPDPVHELMRGHMKVVPHCRSRRSPVLTPSVQVTREDRRSREASPMGSRTRDTGASLFQIHVYWRVLRAGRMSGFNPPARVHGGSCGHPVDGGFAGRGTAPSRTPKADGLLEPCPAGGRTPPTAICDALKDRSSSTARCECLIKAALTIRPASRLFSDDRSHESASIRIDPRFPGTFRTC